VAAIGCYSSAGAYASRRPPSAPASGPADQPLGNLGIDMMVDLAGVGQNLVDHPLVAVGPADPARETARGRDSKPSLHCAPSWRPLGARPICICSRAGPFDVSQDASPTSGVFGIVAGACPTGLPRVAGGSDGRSFGPASHPTSPHLRDPADMARMVEATLIARVISRTAPLADLGRGRRVWRPDRRSPIRPRRDRLSIASRLVDLPPPRWEPVAWEPTPTTARSSTPRGARVWG